MYSEMEQFKNKTMKKFQKHGEHQNLQLVTSGYSIVCSKWNLKHIPQYIRSVFLKNFSLLCSPLSFDKT
jgi:hypothetical protein